MEEKLSVALIGAGRMGAIHARNAAAHPRLRLACIVDPSPAAANLAAELRVELAALDDVLADQRLAGLIIASPTDAHLDHCLQGVKAGKSIFCEKPIDLDIGKVRAAAPALGGARLVLGFNRRYDPHIRRLRARLEAREIDRLETLTIVNHDPAPPPPAFIPRSGGLFRDFTIHDLDLAAWLLDEPIVEIFAAASCLVDPAIAAAGDVDTAKVMLKTGSGRMCVISNTRRSGYGYDQRIEAFGSKGMLRVGNVAIDTGMVLTEGGATSAAIQPGFLQRYAASYRAELDHFADVACGAAEPLTGFAEALAALALADAADASHRANSPVKL